MDDLDLVLNLPGGVARFPIHAGALKAWYDFGLSRPKKMICTSAGALTASTFAGWNDESFEKGIKIIEELTPAHIFTYHRGLKVKLTALGIASLGLSAIVLFDDQVSKGKKVAMGLGGLILLLVTEGMVGREFLLNESLVSVDPLINLLEKKLDFNANFNSSIDIVILVADANKPGKIIFTNRDILNSDSQNPEHRQRWLRVLRATSRIPGKFSFVQIDGINTVDGEVWTDFPINLMKRHKKVVRLDYWPPLQPESSPKDWMSDLSRSFDIMRDRCTQKKMDNYEYERRHNPALPEIFYLRLSPHLFGQMPRIKMHKFTSGDMKALINLGYQSVKEQQLAIREYLG